MKKLLLIVTIFTLVVLFKVNTSHVIDNPLEIADGPRFSVIDCTDQTTVSDEYYFNITTTCRSIFFPEKRILFPADAQAAKAIWYARPGDGCTFINFKGDMYGYFGDATCQKGVDPPEFGLLSRLGCYIDDIDDFEDPTVGDDRPPLTFLTVADDKTPSGQIIDHLINGTSDKTAFFSHLGNAGGLSIGDWLILFSNYVNSGWPSKIHNSTVYRSDDGQVFYNRVGTLAKEEGTRNEPDLTNAFLHIWDGEAVRFLAPRVCQTFFDSTNRPIKTSSYFTKLTDPEGRLMYQNNEPVPDLETLYAYVYGQDLEHTNPNIQDPSNGVLVARVKVREKGVWLNEGNSPIMNADQWNYWDGSKFQSDLQTAQPITPLRSEDEVIKYTQTSDVQYSPHHGKFFMLQTEVNAAYALCVLDSWLDWICRISFLESATPYGPFTNRQLIWEGSHAGLDAMPDDAAIFGILPDKIIATISANWLRENQSEELRYLPYAMPQTGYGAYFASIPIEEK